MPQRLNKYLATHLGISRREADHLIASGAVAIDSQPAIIGARLETTQTVTVKGQPVTTTQPIYLLFHKPAGYVSSRRAQGSAPTLYELLPKHYQNLKTVGRLDKDSSGLLLLTNDGDFAFAMTHPKFQKTKLYQLTLDTPLEPLHQQMIADFGVQLTDGPSKIALTRLDDTRLHWQAELKEGRNRQIRRTFGALGYTVKTLHRTTFGPYHLTTLPPATWQETTKK